MLNNPMNAVTTKFVRTSTNKVKCPVFVIRVSVSPRGGGGVLHLSTLDLLPVSSGLRKAAVWSLEPQVESSLFGMD